MYHTWQSNACACRDGIDTHRRASHKTRFERKISNCYLDQLKKARDPFCEEVFIKPEVNKAVPNVLRPAKFVCGKQLFL